MFDYLENLRMKPGHVRRQIAAGTAACLTAFVAVGWFAVNASSGTFALAPADAAPALDSSETSHFADAFSDTKSGFASLLGAAGASFSSGSDASGIVIQTQSSTTVNQEQPTSISF